MSALEVTSQRENLRDLLEPYSTENDQSPGVYLRNLPVNRLSASNPSTHDYLANQSELRYSVIHISTPPSKELCSKVALGEVALSLP